MNRCVIVGGADIQDYNFVKKFLHTDDYYIFCDSGLAHMHSLDAQADLIVGDFDSHPVPALPEKTIVLPREKDDTDTVFAVKEALRRGFDRFLIIGAVGGRLDHTLGNVSILTMLSSLGKEAVIVDDYSLMQIVAKEPVEVTADCKYFSLLNISGTARGIRVTNAAYPLENASIECTYQYGISNEVLPGKTACVSVGEGSLLLIRIYRNRLDEETGI